MLVTHRRPTRFPSRGRAVSASFLCALLASPWADGTAVAVVTATGPDGLSATQTV
jgi:hypothetical protein